MVVNVTAETAKKLNDLAASTGRAPDQLVEDALAGYSEELAALRETIDSRYDDLTSGRVPTIDGDEALRQIRAKSDARRSGA